MPRREKELRCFCSREPLLATYGIDSRGKLFVHIKIWKQRRIFGEIVVERGPIKIRCRECMRWHRVVIRHDSAALCEETPPDTVSVVP